MLVFVVMLPSPETNIRAVPLLGCYDSVLPAQLCNVCMWDAQREKNGHRARLTSTGIRRRCRLLMMYEVRGGVHQPAGRLLLHPRIRLPLCHLHHTPHTLTCAHCCGISQPCLFLYCSPSGFLSTPGISPIKVTPPLLSLINNVWVKKKNQNS